MTIDLVMGEHAMVASASGAGAEQSTTNRGFWVKSNAEGREKDRYFKYINEFVLTSYGAQKVGTNEETGDGIFSWTGVAKTADGNPSPCSMEQSSRNRATTTSPAVMELATGWSSSMKPSLKTAKTSITSLACATSSATTCTAITTSATPTSAILVPASL